MGAKRVLAIGLDPEYADFTDMPGLTPQVVRAFIDAQIEGMRGLGYEVESCLIDTGEQAHLAVETVLLARSFDCVVIGNGLRTPPDQLLLFEKIINVVHELGRGSRIAFNTKPSDTAEAARRWIGQGN
jgi:hypothetical protein